MDTNGVKPPREPKGFPSTMQEMMEGMCCSDGFSPADMCRRMMASMRRTSSAETPSAHEAGATPDERGTSSQDDAHGGGSAAQPCCAPKRP